MAFFGPVRAQIKQLVEVFDEGGFGKEFLGFSNSRMAYDDVFSRTALAAERGSLSEKITSADLNSLYRSDEPTIGIDDSAYTPRDITVSAARSPRCEAPQI